MVTSDFIAIGILIFCVVLGVLGTFKWLGRLLVGAVFGVLILVCIGLLADNPRFNELSRGVFRDGVVIPCIRHHVGSMGDIISQASRMPSGESVVIGNKESSTLDSEMFTKRPAQ